MYFPWHILGLGLELEANALILIHLSGHKVLIDNLLSQISRLVSKKERVQHTGIVLSGHGMVVRGWHFGNTNPSPNTAYPRGISVPRRASRICKIDSSPATIYRHRLQN